MLRLEVPAYLVPSSARADEELDRKVKAFHPLVENPPPAFRPKGLSRSRHYPLPRLDLQHSSSLSSTLFPRRRLNPTLSLPTLSISHEPRPSNPVTLPSAAPTAQAHAAMAEDKKPAPAADKLLPLPLPPPPPYHAGNRWLGRNDGSDLKISSRSERRQLHRQRLSQHAAHPSSLASSKIHPAHLVGWEAPSRVIEGREDRADGDTLLRQGQQQRQRQQSSRDQSPRPYTQASRKPPPSTSEDTKRPNTAITATGLPVPRLAQQQHHSEHGHSEGFGADFFGAAAAHGPTVGSPPRAHAALPTLAYATRGVRGPVRCPPRMSTFDATTQQPPNKPPPLNQPLNLPAGPAAGAISSPSSPAPPSPTSNQKDASPSPPAAIIVAPSSPGGSPDAMSPATFEIPDMGVASDLLFAAEGLAPSTPQRQNARSRAASRSRRSSRESSHQLVRPAAELMTHRRSSATRSSSLWAAKRSGGKPLNEMLLDYARKERGLPPKRVKGSVNFGSVVASLLRNRKTVDALREAPAFADSGLDPLQLHMLAYGGLPRSLPRYGVVYRAGAHASAFYVLMRGSVLVEPEEGASHTLAASSSGVAFGLDALNSSMRRSSTVSALEPCEILTFHTSDVTLDEAGLAGLATSVFSITVEEALRRTPLFLSLGDETLKHIAPLFELCNLDASVPIFLEGDACESL